MKKLTAAKQRFLENVTLIAASRLIFSRLQESGAPLYCLSDLADTTSGGTPDRGVSNYYGGRISWLKSGELNDSFIDRTEEFITDEGLQNSSAKIYPKGTLVVALYGATVGKTGILTIDAASNQAVCAVVPRTKEITTRYLYWFFRYKRPEFLNTSFGGAQPNISQKVVRETKLPLPSIELQEQICEFLDAVERRKNGLVGIDLPNLPAQLSGIHQIVARIEELAAQIEEARELRRRATEELDALKKSYLKNYFLDLDEQKGNKIPLRQLVTVFGGGTPSKHNAGYWNGEIPWVSPKDMTSIEIVDSLDHITEDAISESSTSLVPINSVLIVVRSGILRRTIPVAVNRVPVTINQDLKALIPNSDVTPEYIRWWITANEAQVLQFVKGGTTVQSLVWKKVMEIGICVPPIEDQHRIITYLDALKSKLDALKRHQTETAAKLDALLPAVLERAFRGEL